MNEEDKKEGGYETPPELTKNDEEVLDEVWDSLNLDSDGDTNG